MPKRRDYHRYELKQQRKVVYKGITNNPERREEEHKDGGKLFSNMKIIGPSVTKKTAEDWEEKSLQSYRDSHGGINPKYNELDK